MQLLMRMCNMIDVRFTSKKEHDYFFNGAALPDLFILTIPSASFPARVPDRKVK
jgi:hypothetical protein